MTQRRGISSRVQVFDDYGLEDRSLWTLYVSQACRERQDFEQRGYVQQIQHADFG